MRRYLLIIAIVIGFLLRFYQLHDNPPGFYSDEASYAYNAYSILQTGRDEHGKFLPLAFEAFGDYKLPVMSYSIVTSFAVFGPSEWAARVPGAFYSTASILVLYFLVKELIQHSVAKTKKQTHLQYLPEVSALLLAITPAHIFVSRGTWELTPALFFIMLGTLLFLKSLHRELQLPHRLLLLGGSAFNYILSLYAYNSARVFVPLLGVALLVIYSKPMVQAFFAPSNRLKTGPVILVTFLLSLLACLPLLKTLTQPEVTQRAKYISVFYDKTIDANLFHTIRSDGGQPVLITRLLHNKLVFYGTDIFRRYLSHFDPNFLFTAGDTFEIFRIVGIGFLPLFFVVFLVYGLYRLTRDRPQWLWLLLIWLLIAPLASSLTVYTPSLSRAHNMVIPLVIFTAYGLLVFLESIKRQKTLAISLISLAAVLNISYFCYQYFVITPQILAHKWNDGFQQTVQHVQSLQNNYDQVVISSSQARGIL